MNFPIEITAFSGMALAIFMLVLLIMKPKKKAQDAILAGWFLGISIHFLYFYLSYKVPLTDRVLLQSAGSALPILHIPLIFLYAKKLIGEKIGWYSMIVVAPFIAYTTVYYVAISNDLLVVDKLSIIVSSHAPFFVDMLAPSMIITVLIFITLLIQLSNKQKRTLHQQFSNEDRRTLLWVNYWVITVTCGAIAIIVSILFADFGILDHSISYVLTFLVIAIQIVLIGQYGLHQTEHFVNYDQVAMAQGETEKKKYQNSGLNESEMEIIKKRLVDAMTESRLYLNPDLTIHELAEHIGSTSNQVSQTLSTKVEENFFDFVNRYRVQEAKKKLKDPDFDQLSILGIALESGFKSKSTFNKCFKRFTGSTPSGYKKETDQ